MHIFCSHSIVSVKSIILESITCYLTTTKQSIALPLEEKQFSSSYSSSSSPGRPSVEILSTRCWQRGRRRSPLWRDTRAAQDAGVTDSGLLELLPLVETAELCREKNNPGFRKKPERISEGIPCWTLRLFLNIVLLSSSVHVCVCVFVCECWKEVSVLLTCCCFLETPKENFFPHA